MTNQNDGPSQAPNFPPIIENSNQRQFRMGDYLGKGGFAWCYTATDVVTNEVYAVKVISKKWLTKQHHHDKVNREIRIHNNINHQHIVKLYSAFSDQLNIYILLEYCKHKSIVNVMRSRQTLTENETRRYVYELLLALMHLHEDRHVLHRDVKLGNMLLDHKYMVKLCDFGLATDRQSPPPLVPDTRSETISICGTPNYISPEILRKEGHSVSSESWAVGCVMYAMLHGRPPFETQNLEDTYAHIRMGKYALLDSLSPAASDLIQLLLRPEPCHRPTPRQMLQHQFLQEETLSRNPILSCRQQQQQQQVQHQQQMYNPEPQLQQKEHDGVLYSRVASCIVGAQTTRHTATVAATAQPITSCALSNGRPQRAVPNILCRSTTVGATVKRPVVQCQQRSPNSHNVNMSPPPLPNIINTDQHVPYGYNGVNGQPLPPYMPVTASVPVPAPSPATQLGTELLDQCRVQSRSCTSRGSADSGVSGLGVSDVLATNHESPANHHHALLFAQPPSPPSVIIPEPAQLNAAGGNGSTTCCVLSPRLSSQHCNVLLFMRNLLLNEVQSPHGFQLAPGAGQQPWLMQLPTTVTNVPMRRVLCVTKWIDYTNRLGFGAQLNDGSVWTWYKDGATMMSTLLPCQPASDYYEFVSADGSVSRSFVASADQLHTLDADMRARLSTFNLFRRYMDNNLMGGQSQHFNSSSSSQQSAGVRGLLTWFRSEVDVLLVFADGSVQINNSQSHIKVHLALLNHAQVQVTFLDATTCQPSSQYLMGVKQDGILATCATADLVPLMQSLAHTLANAAMYLTNSTTGTAQSPKTHPAKLGATKRSSTGSCPTSSTSGLSPLNRQAASAFTRSSSCAQLHQQVLNHNSNVGMGGLGSERVNAGTVMGGGAQLTRTQRCKVTHC